MKRTGDDVVQALLRQWELLALAVPALDLDQLTRLAGWRNRELLAHLAIQPRLLGGFLHRASAAPPELGLVDNLKGTSSLAEVIDAAARDAATASDVDLATAVDDVRAELLAADLTLTVVGVQGPICLADYLVTRCVEAVVHGLDFVPLVEPDPVAEALARDALLEALAATRPDLVAEARDLPPRQWMEIATGRRHAPPTLAAAVPVMT